MHHNYSSFSHIEYGKRESPNQSPSESGMTYRKHLWKSRNIFQRKLHAIQEVISKPSALVLIPKKRTGNINMVKTSCQALQKPSCGWKWKLQPAWSLQSLKHKPVAGRDHGKAAVFHGVRLAPLGGGVAGQVATDNSPPPYRRGYSGRTCRWLSA